MARRPLCAASAPGAASPGLSVRQDGVLVKDGRPFRAIGVNYFNESASVLPPRGGRRPSGAPRAVVKPPCGPLVRECRPSGAPTSSLS